MPADGHQKLSMGCGDVEVVEQDRHGLHDVIHERLTLSSLLTLGQLDADTQLGHGDRRDGDVVLIGDQPVQVVA